MLKKKYIDGTGWYWLEKYSSRFMHIDDSFSGYISLIYADKVRQIISVDYNDSDISLFEDDYKCIVFLPDNENWCVSVIYNTHDEVVEWYFDLTKENSIDEEGIPYFIDLYLDIAVSPQFEHVILDEDELKTALDSMLITKSEYNMAYNTCNRIIKDIISDKEFLVNFFQKYLKALKFNIAKTGIK